MSRVTDYSKWDHIDLSDDEETYHPNIDSSLMIKINREQRARREAEEKKEREEVAKKLKDGKLTEKEAEKELKKIDQKSKINVDNAGVVTTSRTIINSKPDYRPPRPPKDEEDEQMQLDKFIRKYTPLLEKYVETTDFAACEKFLLDEANSKMLTEQACSAMLLHQLDLQMAGKVAQSKKATRQYLILRNVMDLKNEGQGYSLDKPVDPRQMVFKYFQSMNGKSELQQELKEKTETFHAQIAGRAVQKNQEMLDAAAAGEDGYEVTELTPEEFEAWKKENPDAVIEKADEEVIERAVENSTQRKEEKAQFVAPPMPDVD